MLCRIILIFTLIVFFNSCSKKEIEYEPKAKVDPYILYQEAFDSFNNYDYFAAEKKFSEAELNFTIVEFAAKSAIMASYSLYGINFYSEALYNLEKLILNGIKL